VTFNRVQEFWQIKTPDDGRLGPKHVLTGKNKNSCIVDETVLLCVSYNNATGCLNTILRKNAEVITSNAESKRNEWGKYKQFTI
jgi:hypothetical protein